MKLSQNTFIANQLRETATLLDQQGANRFRVAAYRNAADVIDRLPEPVETILRREGFTGLTALPAIGNVIAAAIIELVHTGQWRQLERLRGSMDSEALFRRVPGIGPALARHVIDNLHIDNLEALESAAHDGRLEKLPGFGARRVAMVRAALAELLGRHPRRTGIEPNVAMLLDVDREYREKAAAAELPRISPKRFNPENKQWLPILHTERGEWQFTVVFSNTALAHSLNRVHDWVVIYFHTDSHMEGQRTLVTETHGTVKGNRVVRGRERECYVYYQPGLFQPTNVA